MRELTQGLDLTDYTVIISNTRCSDIMTLSSDFVKLLYFCQESQLPLVVIVISYHTKDRKSNEFDVYLLLFRQSLSILE